MFTAALRASLTLPGLVLIGSMVGFGSLARDAGWSLFEMTLASVVIWALPAQVILIGALASGAGVAAALVAVSLSSIRLLPMVCSILPVVFRPGTSLFTRMAASHYVAQTVWVLTLLNADRLARDERPAFYFWMANLVVFLSVCGGVVGWFLAGRLPRPLDIALLMLTPVSFLLSTEKTAARFDMKLAFALGLLLLPVAHELAPLVGLGEWDMLIAGVVAGGVAFLAGRARGVGASRDGGRRDLDARGDDPRRRDRLGFLAHARGGDLGTDRRDIARLHPRQMRRDGPHRRDHRQDSSSIPPAASAKSLSGCGSAPWLRGFSPISRRAARWWSARSSAPPPLPRAWRSRLETPLFRHMPTQSRLRQQRAAGHDGSRNLGRPYTSTNSPANAARCWMKANRASGLLPIRRSTEPDVSARSSSTTATFRRRRFVGSIVVSFNCAGIISPRPLKRLTSTFWLALKAEAMSCARCGFVARVQRLGALRQAEEGRGGEVEVATLDEARHLPPEEGDQQRCDMRPVDVCISHDDDLLVAQVIVAVGRAHSAAEGLDEILQLLVLRELVAARRGHVEDFPAQRQDGLTRPVARLLGRPSRRIALDDEQLRSLGGIARAVGELAGKAELARRRLARHVLLGASPEAVLGPLYDEVEELGGLRRAVGEPVIERILDRLLDHAARLRRHQAILGLAGEFGLSHEDREHNGARGHQVIGGDLGDPLVPDPLAHGP